MSTEEKFLAAVEVINSIPYDGTFEPSQEMMLKLYAYEKQAKEGACYVPKPYVWNTVERTKWNAWCSLGNMSREVAMESYIEELTKVIETMSYNEKIAKFMSLMGPFYEVVPTHEEKEKWSEKSISATILENYNPPTILELYRMSKNTTDEKSSCIQSSRSQLPESFEFLEKQTENSSSSTSSSEMSNFDLLSDLSAERDCADFFKSKNNCPFLTEKDLLLLAFINLQSSMEGILRKLDNMNILAESVNQENFTDGKGTFAM
ncbi:acyl-CoA-binding domain-containing protein 5 [Caerostris extrusa]|uniref:Acyl-CoA-binding domain-containing protein 5 n=1 Tax=Caerostris extrusa TaxID=172846 RepID=A0AAV4MJ03_CAEEX|nr:acyl-CoA-binding domain-containing protein 5 [Caerostris extrusa]